MSGLKWEEPPPKRGGRRSTLTEEIVAELRANPGRWARLPDRWSSAASQGWKRKWPDLEYRMTDHKVEANGSKTVTWYVRFPGEEPS